VLDPAATATQSQHDVSDVPRSILTTAPFYRLTPRLSLGRGAGREVPVYARPRPVVTQVDDEDVTAQDGALSGASNDQAGLRTSLAPAFWPPLEQKGLL
jgi:hypothetical protein